MLRVSRKLIMRKVKAIHDEASDNGLSMQESFVASRDWLDKFMKQNGLSLKKKNNSCSKKYKLAMYAAQVRRLQQKFNYSTRSIIAMDETAVWYDMVSETTVDKTGREDISLKSSGHEKLEVSVYLTEKADRTGLEPFIVFGGTVRECKSLNEEFMSKCVAISSPNAWMNKELTLSNIRSVIGRFSFNRRLLSWNSFHCHTTRSVREVLKDFNGDTLIIPGGCIA